MAEALPLWDPAWMRFVESCVDAGPFHHPAWAEMLAESYRLEAFALVVRSPEGAVTGGLPMIAVARGRRRRWISLPFTDWCGPLLSRGTTREGFAAALDRVRRANGLVRLEVRDAIGNGRGYDRAEGFRHVRALGPDADAVFADIGKRRRRGICKAEREGVSVRRIEGPQDLRRSFYRLHVLTRRRLGVPVQPVRFFELLWSRLLARGLGFGLVGQRDGVPIAAALFLHHGGQLVYKFSASDWDLRHLRGTDAVIAQALRWGCGHGCRALDFGRTETGNEGLRIFKASWGAQERPLSYATFADRPPRPRRDASLRATKAVIRRSPPWVARAVGFMGYRYTA
jgi:CelD/BcsL family acetyltransferase involved in cellulose biosynthesis